MSWCCGMRKAWSVGLAMRMVVGILLIAMETDCNISIPLSCDLSSLPMDHLKTYFSTLISNGRTLILRNRLGYDSPAARCALFEFSKISPSVELWAVNQSLVFGKEGEIGSLHAVEVELYSVINKLDSRLVPSVWTFVSLWLGGEQVIGWACCSLRAKVFFRRCYQKFGIRKTARRENTWIHWIQKDSWISTLGNIPLTRKSKFNTCLGS